MDILASQEKIRELLMMLSFRVKRENISDRYDINRLSESIMLPVLRLLYDYKDLRNLNYTDERNYPGIDLADDTAKIAFQITSTASNAKIKHTLETIKRHHKDKTYQRFVVFILTEKHGKYSDKDYANVGVEFLKDRDIWDYKDLSRRVSEITDLARLRRVVEELEKTVGRNLPFRHCPPEDKTEELELNFIEIDVPDTLYFADIDVDREQLVEIIQMREKVQKKYRPAFKIHDRETVCEHFEQRLISYPKDFVCFNKQLVTFHDLFDDEHPFRSAIDLQTVKTVSVKSFVTGENEFDESKYSVVKELLGRCLTRMLVKHGISWHDREKLYFFTFDDASEDYIPFHNKDKSRFERIERWKEKRSAPRFVSFRRYKMGLPNETSYYFHLAFKTRFNLIGESWYLEITPDWHASLDGYKNSRTFYDSQARKYRSRKIQFLSDKVTAQKNEQEANQSVFNHFRFIRTFLRNITPPFSKYSENRFFIKFGGDIRFNSSPILEDKVWNPDFVKFQDENAGNNESDETKSKRKKGRKRKSVPSRKKQLDPNQQEMFGSGNL
jgi:hypothetical protein